MSDAPLADQRPRPSSPPPLRREEDAELVRRLAETEAMLAAVIAGQVDAVATPEGDTPVLLRHAQEALRRSEERYRDLVARSPAIVCELTPDGTTTFVNQAVAAILGYEPAELLGGNWWTTLSPAANRHQVGRLYEHLRRGDVTNYELILAAKDGSERTVVWTSVNRHAAGGALESIVAFGLDITERKRAEEATQRLAVEQAARAQAEEAERRAALLAEASRVLASSLDYQEILANVANLVVPTLGDWCAIDLLDEDGTAQRIAVRHVDPAKMEWVKQLQERYPPDPNATRGVAHVLRTGQTELYPCIPDEILVQAARDEQQLELLRKLGLQSAIIVPIQAFGRVLGALTLVCESPRCYSEADLQVAQDLAHRAAVAVNNGRLYREAEKARAEAEVANRAKMDFLAMMSHELRTPLNAIGGYADLLQEEIAGPMTPKQREYVTRIRRSQHHLLGLINDVLNFAKLDAGRVEIDLTEVAIAHALSEINSLIEPQAQQRRLTFEYRPGRSDITVCADVEKLVQVTLNLLSNAVKFTNPGGRVVLTWDADDTRARIQVIDNGKGIAPEKINAIFEPFVQLRQDTTDAWLGEGTGLGLAISRELARAMGGDLTAVSKPGEGSIFTLSLPIHCPSSPTPAPPV